MSENQAPKPSLVTLFVDGQEIKVPPGTPIIKAAEKLQKSIPHFCYHEGLSVVGQCRMCFVEIEGMPKLATACSTVVSEGMKILTDSPKVKSGQNATLEFTLLNHPLDCPICDRGGECKLQDYTYEFGPPLSRLYDDKVLRDKHKPVSQQVILDQERCILCTRCVRFSSEVDGRAELVVNQRGNANVIDVFEERPMESRFSGNVVDLCPVGALTAKDFRFAARPWELKKHEAICTGCAVGCNVEIDTKHRHTGIVRPDKTKPNPEIERLMPRTNLQVNQWWMCDKGRWGYHFHNKDELRLDSVKVRKTKQGPLENSSLKEIQALIDSPVYGTGDWEFWVTDSMPVEGLAWAREISHSWKSRGRKVSEINPSPFGEKIKNFWAARSNQNWHQQKADWTGIKKIISPFSARELESIAPILGLRLGQEFRAGHLKWETRAWDKNFANQLEASVDTVVLVPKPSTETDLEVLNRLPSELKFLILWTEVNSRGLINDNLAPLESVAESLTSQKAPAKIFVFSQTTMNPLPKAFIEYCKKAKMLIVADSFQGPLTEFSDIVLPLTPLWETLGTFTNLENLKQESRGIQIEHPNHDYLKRGTGLLNPSLRLL